MGALNITRMVCGAYQANSYLVSAKERDDAFIIDPGDNFDLLSQTLRASGRRLTDILLTHGHFDHTLSAGRLARETGAHIHIHPFDASMLEDSQAALYDASASALPFESCKVDSSFEITDYADMEIAGIPLTLIYCPGHSPGGMSFYSKPNGMVFTGDTIFEDAFGRTDFPGGSVKQLRRSLKKLLKLPKETLVHPGHGYSTLIERILEGWK